VTELAKDLFALHGRELSQLKIELREIEVKLKAWHRQNAISRRLAEVDAIGPIGGCLLAIKAPDPRAFRCGRDFAAWMGLTPKDHSTAGKTRLGTITRAGDDALRRTLVLGATSVIKQLSGGKGNPSPWLRDLVARKPPKLAAVALANKVARIAWKLMVSGSQEAECSSDRSDCGHMSGLLWRSHMTAAKMGSTARAPNITAVCSHQRIPRSFAS
jgi:transposase